MNNIPIFNVDTALVKSKITRSSLFGSHFVFFLSLSVFCVDGDKHDLVYVNETLNETHTVIFEEGGNIEKKDLLFVQK